MAKRKTAGSLVRGCVGQRRGLKWLDGLSATDRRYVNDVVRELRASPNAAVYIVAKGIKEELNLVVHCQTVARTLKELVNATQKTK